MSVVGFPCPLKVKKLVQAKGMKTRRNVKVSAKDFFMFDIDDEELKMIKDGTYPSNMLKNNVQAGHAQF